MMYLMQKVAADQAKADTLKSVSSGTSSRQGGFKNFMKSILSRNGQFFEEALGRDNEWAPEMPSKESAPLSSGVMNRHLA